MSAQDRITVVVLDGGPHGGKTTALAHVANLLITRGFLPVFVPEAATLLIEKMRISPASLDIISFEEELFGMMCYLEGTAERAANKYADADPHAKIVIVCDRGLASCKAYLPDPETQFPRLLGHYGMNLASARDGRYKAVIHMTSTAVGAPEHYSTANNAARRETVEEAAALDRRTLNAWVGHPHLREIDNRLDGWDGKLKRLEREMCTILGIPVPREIERKFLVKQFPLSDIDKHAGRYQDVRIVQTYLQDNDPLVDERRLRKRSIGNAAVYFETLKRLVSRGVREETERLLTKEQYFELVHFADPKYNTLEKRRCCFIYKGQYFELDRFDEWGLLKGDWLLEIELTELSDTIDLPPWIPVIREVTGEQAFSNRELARKWRAS